MTNLLIVICRWAMLGINEYASDRSWQCCRSECRLNLLRKTQNPSFTRVIKVDFWPGRVQRVM